MDSPAPMETDKIGGMDVPKPVPNQSAVVAQSASSFSHNPFRPEVYRTSDGVMR